MNQLLFFFLKSPTKRKRDGEIIGELSSKKRGRGSPPEFDKALVLD